MITKVLLMLSIAVGAHAQISSRERLDWYWSQAYGPTAWVRAGFAAGLSHLSNSPEEWEQGAAGYGRRFASRFGQNMVEDTIVLGAGWALAEDPRYKRQPDLPAGRRVWHALRSTLVWRADDGRLRPAIASVGGVYGGAMISMAWHPDRFRATGDGVRIANIRMASTAGLNLVREFWPEIRRIFKR
jgi:hypothetical protein